MLKRKTTPQTPLARERQLAKDSRARSARDPHVRKLLRRSREILERRGVHQSCSVDIERRGRWYVLRGRVDSHRTRSQLFGMIPEADGAQWIVDHLRVDTRARIETKS
jgi:hypothetical protein